MHTSHSVLEAQSSPCSCTALPAIVAGFVECCMYPTISNTASKDRWICIWHIMHIFSSLAGLIVPLQLHHFHFLFTGNWSCNSARWYNGAYTCSFYKQYKPARLLQQLNVRSSVDKPSEAMKAHTPSKQVKKSYFYLCSPLGSLFAQNCLGVCDTPSSALWINLSLLPNVLAQLDIQSTTDFATQRWLSIVLVHLH